LLTNTLKAPISMAIFFFKCIVPIAIELNQVLFIVQIMSMGIFIGNVIYYAWICWSWRLNQVLFIVQIMSMVFYLLYFVLSKKKKKFGNWYIYVGPWHLVGPAHLLAILVKAHSWACLLKPHKISLWFNAKLTQGMSNTRWRKKEKKVAKGKAHSAWVEGWRKRAIFGHFSVSFRVSTKHRIERAST